MQDIIRTAIAVTILTALAACTQQLQPRPEFRRTHAELIDAQRADPAGTADDRLAGYTGVQIYNNVYLPSVTTGAGSE